MTLEPYECIHCKAETQDYTEVHMKFRQRVVEHFFGQNYEKDSQIVDAGNAYVFVCDKCVRDMKLFNKHYVLKLICAAVLALIAILAAYDKLPLWLCLLPQIGVMAISAMRSGEYTERAKHQHRNNIVNVGYTRNMAVNFASIEGANVSGFFQGLGLLAAFILSTFVTGVLLKILCWALFAIAVVTALASLFGMLSAKGPISANDRYAAACYYLLYDENIMLVD